MATTGADDASWARIAARLAPSRGYWLSTTNRDGSPHTAPVWGAVVMGSLYVYSERTTVKSANLERDSRGVIHLESAEDVLIVHGHFDDLGVPQLLSEVMQAFAKKYDQPEDAPYLPAADPSFDVIYRLRPQKALQWSFSGYEDSQLRWIAPSRI